MKQVAGLIATYSSDEFGICSALYELGGMVVMHDASGCNSTYTTHDEPRWYDMDSMIFISAISEMEAIMGDDDKLIGDLVETANELHPKFIAIVGAPIPYMIGTDFKAIAAVTEEQTGIPCMGFKANGMHGYLKGVSMAMEAVAMRFCIREIERSEHVSANILGATPLDFSLNGSVDSIKEWLLENGVDVNACFAMGSSLEELKLAGRAHVNLVVSYGGLSAAEKLWELFGTPYVVGVPHGAVFAKELAEDLKRAIQSRESIVGYKKNTERAMKNETQDERVIEKKEQGDAALAGPPLAIIGENVFSASLACAIEMERGIPVRVLCPVDTEDFLLRDGDIRTLEEDDLIEQIPEYAGVIADPMYRFICPPEVKLYELPHEAFSGRIYDDVNPNLINRKLVPGRPGK